MNNLLKYRIWKNWTQKELSKRAGTSVNAIRRIEKNRKMPKYTIRRKLCEVFGVRHNQLFPE